MILKSFLVILMGYPFWSFQGASCPPTPLKRLDLGQDKVSAFSRWVRWCKINHLSVSKTNGRTVSVHFDEGAWSTSEVALKHVAGLQVCYCLLFYGRSTIESNLHGDSFLKGFIIRLRPDHVVPSMSSRSF